MIADLPLGAFLSGGIDSSAMVALMQTQSPKLVPVRDAVALAAALERLIRDSDLCQRMGQRGRERAEGEFSQQRVAAETLAVYRELLH